MTTPSLPGIEKVLDADPLVRYPVCLDGQGAGPPEDCGGVWGYRELLFKPADHQHEDHERMRRWLGLGAGEDLEPERFDVDDANRRLWAASLRANGG